MTSKQFGDYGNIYIGGEENASPVMTSTEAADYLKMHVKTVCRLAKEGKIPAKKVGSEWRFLKAVLDQFTLEPEFLNQFLSEGLTVLAWVMLWAPLALLLLDWWPARRNIDGYLAIRDMEIEILSSGDA